MDLVRLKAEIDELRQQWRLVRQERLKCKQELVDAKYTVQKIRHDHTYRQLRKQQRALSVRITHLEQELNRMRARYEK